MKNVAVRYKSPDDRETPKRDVRPEPLDRQEVMAQLPEHPEVQPRPQPCEEDVVEEEEVAELDNEAPAAEPLAVGGAAELALQEGGPHGVS